jgi:hypothetical protein
MIKMSFFLTAHHLLKNWCDSIQLRASDLDEIKSTVNAKIKNTTIIIMTPKGTPSLSVS